MAEAQAAPVHYADSRPAYQLPLGRARVGPACPRQPRLTNGDRWEDLSMSLMWPWPYEHYPEGTGAQRLALYLVAMRE
jgi:hypothetical protein